jgi:hypothetical protein
VLVPAAAVGATTNALADGPAALRALYALIVIFSMLLKVLGTLAAKLDFAALEAVEAQAAPAKRTMSDEAKAKRAATIAAKRAEEAAKREETRLRRADAAQRRRIEAQVAAMDAEYGTAPVSPAPAGAADFRNYL